MDTHSLPIHGLMTKKYRGFPLALLLILVLAALLRFVALGSLPVSIYWDEASAGYNAYSILHTGRDEHGELLPFFFRSFNDAKMPVMIYLSTLPIALFGLNEFSVRSIAAFSGVLTILFTFLFTRELFRQHTHLKLYAESVGITAAFLLTISPWHIQFSRAGFEATVALCFIVVGSYVFLKALTRPGLFFLSAVLFIISLITYRSAILFVPVLFIGFAAVYVPILKKPNQRITFLLSAGLLFMIWIFVATVLFRGDSRYSQVSIFSPDNIRIAESITKQADAGNTFFSRILYNRRVVYAQIALENYLSHFDPRFLFTTGDGNGRHTVTGMGLLHLFEAIFLIFGAWWIFKREKRIFFLLLLWIMAAPLAASITTPAPHALRSLTMIPALSIVSASGIIAVVSMLPKHWRVPSIGIIGVVILVSVLIFLNRYTVHNRVIASPEWADGYKQLVTAISQQEENYEKIVITGHGWQPYIYFLFYKKYDPANFQRDGSSDGFARYRFGGTNWDQQVERAELDAVDLASFAGTKNALVVLSPEEYTVQEAHVRKLSEIRNSRGDTAFIITELRQ